MGGKESDMENVKRWERKGDRQFEERRRKMKGSGGGDPRASQRVREKALVGRRSCACMPKMNELACMGLALGRKLTEEENRDILKHNGSWTNRRG